MKVLVTGASGFVGSQRVKHLLANHHEVIGVGNHHKSLQAPIAETADVAERDSLKYVVSRFRPDRIEHFASQAIVDVSRDDPWGTYRTNVLGAVSILEVAKKAKIPIMVFTTDKYYGNREVSAEYDRPVVCAGAYETSKLCQDLVAQSYREQGVDVTILRSCNVFGAGDYNRRIVPNVLRTLQTGRRPLIYNNIVGVRQYIYIDDLMSAIDATYLGAVESPHIEKTYNIGTDIKMTQAETVQKIVDVWNSRAGAQIVPEFRDGPQLNEIPSQYLDWNKLKSSGWRPNWEFDEAIARILELEGIPEHTRVVKTAT